MKEEFITYEQAVKLKELGFDEPCMFIHDTWGNTKNWTEDGEGEHRNSYINASIYYSAPLKQQVFRWFREKHDLWFRPDYYDEMREYDYQGSIHQLGRHSSLITLGNCKTVEELEAKCIDELIEMVKKK